MSDNHLALQAQQRILLLRGRKVMLDFHLAELYPVETRALKQAMPRRSFAKQGVRRNPDRFPADFMFELTAEETENLRSQNVIPISHGGSRYGHLPFTEQGVAMLSHDPPNNIRNKPIHSSPRTGTIHRQCLLFGTGTVADPVHQRR